MPLLHLSEVHRSTFGQLVIVLLLRAELLINLGGYYWAHHGWVVEGAHELVLTYSDQQLVGPTQASAEDILGYLV